jgi:alkanesulfonate monooxygenase SsuD/methylene tetrahydromethanopterin reductase-like flavin-dependent oxidoreductase (luciferase family)
LLTAANGKKSMRLAGQHGDGLITDPETWKQYKSEWEAGARAAGKDPATMPVLVEQYVVTGDAHDMDVAAELWRFGPKAFKSYFNIPDPAEIQRKADAEIPIKKVVENWAIGNDPGVHIKKIEELFASGVTIVNVHSGEPDPKKVIDFYANAVLPKFA